MAARSLLIPLLTLMLSVSAWSGSVCAALATVLVTRGDGSSNYAADGAVEALQHAEVAAQVPGRITRVLVQAGDRVRAGALLASIDARAAQDQQAAVRAQLQVAQRDYDRSRELFAQNYISKAAMDRVEAQYRVLQAQLNIAETQNNFHQVVAPYTGIVAEVLAENGEMAQPGKPLFIFYDPTQLRVTIQVPENIALQIASAQAARIEIPSAAPAQKKQVAKNIIVLPTASVTAHTREVRLELAVDTDITPGAFARVLLPLSRDAGSSGQSMRLSIPVRAVVTRTEFSGVYVVDAQARVQLRQVRLGRQSGDYVEVFAGLREGERIALDPLAAIRSLSDE